MEMELTWATLSYEYVEGKGPECETSWCGSGYITVIVVCLEISLLHDRDQ